MKCLTKTTFSLYHLKNSERISGKNDDMRGDCSGLYGDLDKITQDERKENGNIGDYVK